MTRGQYIRTLEIKEKNSKSRKGKGIGICGKYKRTDDIKEKQHLKMKGHPLSETAIKKNTERMLSSENPMKNPEIKASISGINSHRSGIPPIPGKSYPYVSQFQGEVKLNHSWELLYVKYLNSNNIKWYHEYKTFKFIFNNKQTSYTPDFYLPETDEYIEIKGRWIRDAELKFNKFKEIYPNIKIKLLLKSDLKRLGIKIK